jgi:glutamate-5-semialdehyde dehydrogenase
MATPDLKQPENTAPAPADVLRGMLERARAAHRQWTRRQYAGRDTALLAMAAAVRRHAVEILAANAEDLRQSREAGLPVPLQNRLGLTEAGVERLAAGLEDIARLPDPLGRGRGMKTLANGLRLESVTVPLGVIGLVYESRPGVTVDAAGLAVKSGNALLLRGGKEARGSNQALFAALTEGLVEAGLPPDLLQLVTTGGREYVQAMVSLRGLDLLIPRGGNGLIRWVQEHAVVPVIETGVGNCHVYVDRAADLDMAVHIVLDAKVGNPAVCNAIETVLVHEAVAPAFLPRLEAALAAHGVTLHADAKARAWLPHAVPATDDDFAREYLSLDLAVGVVPDLEAALSHIAAYGTGHSEAIVTDDYRAGTTFQASVDAAVVYWNASTRFTDGGQFGLGAEVGISTQKLHARGPMGVEALTTVKTLAWGGGQTRDL